MTPELIPSPIAREQVMAEVSEDFYDPVQHPCKETRSAYVYRNARLIRVEPLLNRSSPSAWCWLLA